MLSRAGRTRGSVRSTPIEDDEDGMVRLGLDMFSLRSQAWTPFEQLDFCARWGVHVAHYSEVRLLGGLAPDHLRRVRAHADAHGIALELGMLSICPLSSRFDAARGTPEEQILAMLPAAAIAGSPFVRCVVGTLDDRRRPGGIEACIDETVRVLKTVRSQVVDAGLKLAVENHAGDLQGRELRRLVEEAGPDFVGVCLDSGNPLWAIEDPHLTLELLAPYVLTSHMRDSAVWRVPEGAAVAWPPMGQGNVDIARYLRTFLARCPGRPLSLEVIVLPAPRIMGYRTPGFWDAYRHTPAWEFDRFAALAEPGSAWHPPAADDPVAAEVGHVEASLRWTRAFLGTA
jgi:sugar phosphate isomerase/epimerase